MEKPLLFAVLLALGTAIAVSAPPVRTLGGKVKETCRTERKSVIPALPLSLRERRQLLRML